MAVLHKVVNHIAQVQQTRTAVDQCDVVHRKRRLQLGVFVQSVQYNTCNGVVFEDDDNACTLVVTLVVDVRNALDFLLVNQLADFLDHIGFVDHIGDFGDYDTLSAALGVLDFGLGTHNDAATACFESFLNTCVAIDDTTCGEVGCFNVLSQLLGGDVAVVDVGAASVHHLAQVVGCHIGSHTYGDTARTVHQQQGNLGGQYGGFVDRLVEVFGEVDGVLLDVGHHLIGDFAHTGLGVTHCSGAVTVHRTEVTLTIDQRVTHRPVLCQTTHCIVNRAVAVGVELTEHVTDDTRRFTVRFVGVEVQLVAHIVEDTAVNRFESVADIRQCARNDNRHRIVDVGLLHLVFDVDGGYLSVIDFFHIFSS